MKHYELNFCQFSECQAPRINPKPPRRNAKPPIENFLATVLVGNLRPTDLLCA